MIEHCNDNLCPDVLAAIIVPSLLLVLAVFIVGIVYFKRNYNSLENNDNSKVSFKMPNVVKISK